MRSFDLAVRCDTLMTLAGGKCELQKDMFLGVKGAQIEEIQPWSSKYLDPKQVQVKRWVEAKGHLIMPSLINGHTHLPMTLYKGLADDHPFADWLFKTILPLERKLTNPEFVRVGTELAVLELIRNGVTTVADMYYFQDSIAEVIDQMGIRGFMGEAVFDSPTPDTEGAPGREWEIIDRMVEKYQGHSRVFPAFGPHATYSCNDATLKQLKKRSEKLGLPILIHVSETQHEVNESIKQYGMTPAERLNAFGLLQPGTVMAHCVHLTPKDIELVAQKGASIIYNPESNMKLGSGAAPVPDFLKAGIPTGIGTDGSASNNDLSLFREMDTGVKLQKLIRQDNTAMTAPQALSLATLGGARALGLEKRIGSLEVGKAADFIAIDLTLPHLQPLHEISSLLVYSCSGSEVQTVVCDGEVLLLEGKHTKADVSGILERVRETAERCFNQT